jgi:hypothetical protein
MRGNHKQKDVTVIVRQRLIAKPFGMKDAKPATAFFVLPLHVASLRANGEMTLSGHCNEAFREIISERREGLLNLHYTVLYSRALANHGF